MISYFAGVAGRFGFNPREAERFIKFLFVGTVGFIVDFGTLAGLVELVGLPDIVADRTPFSFTLGLILANTTSFTLAVVSNFTLNRYWTYPESRTKKKRIQLPQFTAVSIIGLMLNNGILALLTAPFDRLLAGLQLVPLSANGYLPAKAVATAVVLFWNFFVNRYWTYSNVI